MSHSIPRMRTNSRHPSTNSAAEFRDEPASRGRRRQDRSGFGMRTRSSDPTASSAPPMSMATTAVMGATPIRNAPSTGPAMATPELRKKFQPATRMSSSTGTYMGTAA